MEINAMCSELRDMLPSSCSYILYRVYGFYLGYNGEIDINLIDYNTDTNTFDIDFTLTLRSHFTTTIKEHKFNVPISLNQNLELLPHYLTYLIIMHIINYDVRLTRNWLQKVSYTFFIDIVSASPNIEDVYKFAEELKFSY